ncbi:hypothetical protein ANCDUO_17698 [Ancylostoma duodenale]|uniref:Uncharacterized protein n=1 Tax=Ancylostoma duodenale TaxID=51022 RepID=A0A0C2CQW7_9BILA|nr:hypothetical protein ANCDUO_17698 [Ancylostoma duodenale]
MPPYDYGPPPYSGYGDGYYGGGYFGYGPRPYYRRRRPVVIEKTVVYRPGWYGSTSLRQKRQWGRYPPQPIRPGFYGPRRPAVVVQKTVVYRG